MSFSIKVKNELANHISNATHCRIAELAALISMCGSVIIDETNNYKIRIKTETQPTAEKIKKLLWKTFKVDVDISTRENAYSKVGRTYTLLVGDHQQALKILQATKLINENNEIGENFSITNNIVIMKDCCKRAFIRGAFMAAGSISDPNKSYHFEIKCNSEKKAKQLIELLENYNIDGKWLQEKVVMWYISKKAKASLTC